MKHKKHLSSNIFFEDIPSGKKYKINIHCCCKILSILLRETKQIKFNTALFKDFLSIKNKKPKKSKMPK